MSNKESKKPNTKPAKPEPPKNNIEKANQQPIDPKSNQK